MQIKASFSECNTHVICGGEKGNVHVWPIQKKKINLSFLAATKKMDCYDAFKIDDSSENEYLCNITSLFAPEKASKAILNSYGYFIQESEINAMSTESLSNRLSLTDSSKGIAEDYTTRFIFTSDLFGNIRIFLRHTV